MTPRTIVITGANRGIGRAACARLLEDGHRIVLAARSRAKAEDTATELLGSRDESGRILPVALDLLDADSRESFAGRLRELGLDRLDGLLNNAGLFPGFPNHGESPPEADDHSLIEVLTVNTVGCHSLLRQLLPLLEAGGNEDGPACVVNVSSGLGSLALTSEGDLAGSRYLAYQASKAALNMVTIAWANELATRGSSLRINSVSPGWCHSDMGGRQAPRSPEQGASTLISYLLLPSSGPSGGFFGEDGTMPW